VHDLRVELDAVQTPSRLLERGDRRRVRPGDDARAGRRRRHGVAVGHPDRLLPRRPAKELRLVGADLCLAELGDAGSLDGAAELERHQLHPVADAERRDPELEDRRVDARRLVRVNRRRSAAEDERVWVSRADLLGRDVVPDELGVDATFARAPRDQLRVLPAEVEHEHRTPFRSVNVRRRPRRVQRSAFAGRRLHGDGALRKGRHLSADSSAPPS
jgi:hypothetical protein